MKRIMHSHIIYLCAIQVVVIMKNSNNVFLSLLKTSSAYILFINEKGIVKACNKNSHY